MIKINLSKLNFIN